MFTSRECEIPGSIGTKIRREVFTEGSRILGSEYTIESQWRGYDSSARGRPFVTEACTGTHHFATKAEARAWLEDMPAVWIPRADVDDWLADELV